MSVWADNPQAVQIDALIERARRLTAAEIDALVAARVAAGVAAGVAARDVAAAAAWEAAWFAARVADWSAAWSAAWVAAWEAAWDVAGDAAAAAGALVVRDLIVDGTAWDRAAYDLLTGPWRRVIGPIHPDDEVLR